MAQKLAGELGLGVGISSGANFLGALDGPGRRSGRDAVVVTVFPDDNKKYLSTDLLREEPVEAGLPLAARATARLPSDEPRMHVVRGRRGSGQPPGRARHR